MPKRVRSTHTIEQGLIKGPVVPITAASDQAIKARRPIRVVIAGDSHILRSGLRKILENQATIHVIGDISLKHATVESISHYSPDLVLIDLDSREADVLALIGALQNRLEPLPVLVMVELGNQKLARAALTRGAAGIVLKVQPPSLLIAAIHELAQSTYQHSADRREENDHGGDGGAIKPSKDSGAAAKIQSLTARERDIIRLVGHGLKNKDIANRLSISDITVRHHLTSIFCKLEVDDRQKLLIVAHRYGLVDLSESSE